MRRREITELCLGLVGATISINFVDTSQPGGVGHGPKGIMGKKSKTAHLHLTFALFTSLVTP